VSSSGAFDIDNGGGPAMHFVFNSTLAGSDVLLRMAIAVEDDVWVGVGIGTLMVPGYAVIGMGPTLQLASGNPAVGVYRMTGKLATDTNLVPGALASQGITAASFVYAQGVSTLDFSVNISATTYFAFCVAPNNSVNIMFAQGLTGLTVFDRHIFYGLQQLNLYPTGAAGVAGTGTVRVFWPALFAHIILCVLAFCVLFPVGASVALLRPAGSTAWFKVHVGMQISALVIGFAGIVAGIVLRDSRQLRMLDSTHAILGLCVILGCIFQVLVALRRPHAPAKGAPPSKVRTQWFWSHRVVAWFCLFAGLANVILGTDRFTLALGTKTSLLLSSIVVANSTVVQVLLALASAGFGLVGFALLASALRRWRGGGDAAAGIAVQVQEQDESKPNPRSGGRLGVSLALATVGQRVKKLWTKEDEYF
jgi:hypothetical protein